MVKVERVRPDERAQVAAFYKTAGYGAKIAHTDVTLAAKCRGELVGVVRLCDEDGVIVLRGMQVAPAFQRQGVGRTLLEHCAPYLDRNVAYCLPYDHLVQFYGQAGFQPAATTGLPPFLVQRLASYIVSGHKVVAMRRG